MHACRMNPLGLNPERFVIVEDKGSAQVLGIGQMQPQGSFHELRTLIVEPESRQVTEAGLGSQVGRHHHCWQLDHCLQLAMSSVSCAVGMTRLLLTWLDRHQVCTYAL